MKTKKILGLDLGTTSIGWALINESVNPQEASEIIKMGVRVNPLTTDEKRNFSKGAAITTNAERTQKRTMRRNLQRYKLRRATLIAKLIEEGWITQEILLSENGNRSTFQTWELRAKAASEPISLEELARVLLMLNKKRGYKSNRKSKAPEDGEIIDGMQVAEQLYQENLTPGEYSYQLLLDGKKNLPEYYQSDLRTELQKIWLHQRNYYPDLLTENLLQAIEGRNSKQTWAILAKEWHLVGIKTNKKGLELKKEQYRLRTEALDNQIQLEQLANVIQQINGQINNASGYLGAISDRSKELSFHKQTIGQFQMEKLHNNPHHSLKNEVFYRADYLDEFEHIWETQKQYHPQLTTELKKQLRDIIIFYQRPLRSQKGLISFCELERKQITIQQDGKTITKTTGCRVAPKSSPIFQEFRIWQMLNNIILSNSKVERPLDEDEKATLAEALKYQDKMSNTDARKLLFGKEWNNYYLNYKELEGNRTIAALYKAYMEIVNRNEGTEYKNINKVIIRTFFEKNKISTAILDFNSNVSAQELQHEELYKLWHLLYSYEGDKSTSGIDNLLQILVKRYGFTHDQAKILANIKLQDDYGNLSTKAMRNILPYMRDGKKYNEACAYAGYQFSKQSLTREDLDTRPLKDQLDILPKNSLRNPVVEKILNQMVNVVNAVITTYGKPDEVRIEMARELKKTAEQRKRIADNINAETRKHEEYRRILQTEFNLQHVSQNDIIRYKLYLELEANRYQTLYSNTYISVEKLFSKDFEIEHIIPKARLFDDSFSNKTLEISTINREKGDQTAYDYVRRTNAAGLADYEKRINDLAEKGAISLTKKKHLLMSEDNIPQDFLNRDLTDSAYIAKKAKEMLTQVVREVHTTTGSITNRLRQDWQLVNVMQELNWDKYAAINQVEYFNDHDGRTIRRIKDWTKRNDHRHHAIDALIIAFTRPEFINYLNNLNAHSDKTGVVYDIEKRFLTKQKNKTIFLPPMPMEVFRKEVLRQMQDILVSIKAKNKVTTKNINKIRTKQDTLRKIQLTPRGKLHDETFYGSYLRYSTKIEKVGSAFDAAKIATVANKAEREMLLARLHQFDNDPKKAFTGKNKLDIRVKTVTLQTQYTIRKDIESLLSNAKDVEKVVKMIENVVDKHIQQILKQRLQSYGGDYKKAFSNLNENPIYLNKEKNITIKRVTIATGLNNPVGLHDKKDHNGKNILDAQGNPIITDFIQTGNTHHVAIYQDEDGNLQEKVVSFYEATIRTTHGLPVIDKQYNAEHGWRFLFTMKQNEYFVFPNNTTGFEPQEINLLDAANYSDISPNLYRVQKLSSKYYVFRHHLETQVDDTKAEHRDITWKRITSLANLAGVAKVRINHIGQIVSVGEY